ncbi:MAG: pyruvate kinase [Elusimicrobia bacterium HGW-Elusimicrobia-2]|nr:MAG: pyruvate kinase [Elusimicrobia bacterium HGW-Elusimicrobia-2]
MGKTQIIATIGPPTVKKLSELAAAGMSGARINSSHGSTAQHIEIINLARKIKSRPFIIYDIKGPKIRLGDIPSPLHLKTGQRLILRTGMSEKDGWPFTEDFSDGIPVAFAEFHKFVKKGDRLLIDDGLIGMKVEKVRGREIFCEVLYGALLRSRKGINHPDTVVDFPYTVEGDIPLIAFAIKYGVDYIADSFERNAADVMELWGRLRGTGIKIISKIENPEGVKNFNAILKKTDAVMIARGDLGVELDPWEIPELQKRMIEKCQIAGRPVITATQMLESMIDDPRPSRSDVSDIANAIYDGTDAVMLSGETSAGKYPVRCVEMMRKIIQKTESTPRYKKLHKTLARL